MDYRECECVASLWEQLALRTLFALEVARILGSNHATYIPHNTQTNPTTNATVTPRTSHLTLRDRLRQPAVM